MVNGKSKANWFLDRVDRRQIDAIVDRLERLIGVGQPGRAVQPGGGLGLYDAVGIGGAAAPPHLLGVLPRPIRGPRMSQMGLGCVETCDGA